MTLDKKAVEMLLALDDRNLSAVIKRLAKDAGLPADAINLTGNQIAGIRTALSLANEDDLKRASELIGSFKSTQRTP